MDSDSANNNVTNLSLMKLCSKICAICHFRMLVLGYNNIFLNVYRIVHEFVLAHRGWLGCYTV